MVNRLKLVVKNFEIVKEATLVVEGITSIMGETDNGKTAMYNAAKAVVYNLAGKGYIRLQKGKPVKEGCTVTMMFEEDKAIVQFAKSDSPSYLLQKGETKKKYEKVGRGGPPEEVASILNMDDLEVEGTKFSLNFIGQLEAPLLKQMSMFQLYKTVVKSFDGEKIQEAITSVKEDQDVQQKDIGKKEVEIEVQKKQRLLFINQVKTYQPLDALKPLWEGYNTAARNLPQLEEWQGELEVFKLSQDKFNTQLNSLKKVAQVVGWMKDNDAKIVTLETLRDLSANSELYAAQYKTYAQQLKSVDKVSTIAFKTEFVAYLKLKAESMSVQALNNEVLSVEMDMNFIETALAVFPTKLFEEYPRYKKVGQHLNVLEQYQGSLMNILETIVLLGDQVISINKEIQEAQHICDNKLCPMCKGIPKIVNEEAMEELKERIETLQQKKVGIEAKKNAKKEQVDSIHEKISKAGYDPKKLPEEINKLEKEVEEFEKKALPIVDEVEKALADAENEEHLSDPEVEIDSNPITDDFE